MTGQLDAVMRKVEGVLATRPECFVMHPTELKVLQAASEAEVRRLAAEHGWRLVWFLGGRMIQFYHDVTVQPLASGRNAA